MCEKSQLAGIRLHGALTPQFIILIRLLVFSPIPHIHKGVTMCMEQPNPSRTNTKINQMVIPLKITHAAIRTLTHTEVGSGWCRHLNTDITDPYEPTYKNPIWTSSEAARKARSPRVLDETDGLLYLVVPSMCGESGQIF